jgi:CDP-glucose 4,6-dehydratase
MVTSDKVYRNLERPIPYREDDILGGHDPYSASKAASEIVIASYRAAYFKDRPAIATARAGNVIGGGDWSEQRLIPDAVKAWTRGEALELRNPGAIRPWQHVLEPLAGYLVLAEKIWHQPELAGAYNFGPPTHETVSVSRLIGEARAAFGRGEVRSAQVQGQRHEAGLLSLETSKARFTLGVSPRWDLTTAVGKTMQWYSAFEAGRPARDLCDADIESYAS